MKINGRMISATCFVNIFQNKSSETNIPFDEMKRKISTDTYLSISSKRRHIRRY